MSAPISTLDEGCLDVLSTLDYLDERIAGFEEWLKAEPCQHDGHCIVMSNSRRMCAPCRLRLHYYHCVYNADAYRERADADAR